MKTIIILFLLFISQIYPQVKTLEGIVTDSETENPLSSANVFISRNNLGTVSDSHGNFKLTGVIKSTDTLVISYVGYASKLISLFEYDDIEFLEIKLERIILPSQTVFVEGSVGRYGITPLAFNQIKRREIQKDYVVQDIPEYLSRLPSTTYYSESGNGIGYNYLSIRGFDQRRISVSINGIPQNDPEDHNIYWLDFPDLLASTEMIQVQRGAGAGVTGYPAIGGSINIITSTFSDRPKFNLSASYGSYHTRKYSAAYSSGLIDNKYSIYANLSQILSSGYRNLSWVKFNAYHLSVVRYDNNITSQINFFGGPIEDGLAYTGVAKFAVKDRELRRENYSYWEADESGYTYTAIRRNDEIENFSQPHYELLNEIKIFDNVKFNSALFLVIGKGFFDYDGSWADTNYLRLTYENGFTPTQNPGNVLIRAMVENKQFGWIPRLSYKHKNGELIAGGEFRIHRSEHWGAINYGEKLPEGITKDFYYYFYNGSKDIVNGFVHETYNFNERINLLGEIQISYHKYGINNEKYVNNNFEIDDLFVNPRFGINYKFAPQTNVFLSFARVTREPRLKDYYDAAESSGGAEPMFELNSDSTYNFSNPLVKPETMNDIELGFSYNSGNLNLNLNLFYMLFDDEIVKKGTLDRFGQPITGNIDKTTHTGVELSFIYKYSKNFELFGNATYSRNEINEGKYFLDDGNYLILDGNSISGFPDFLTNFGMTFTYNNMYLRLSGKFVREFYSDNFDNKLNKYLSEFSNIVDYSDNVNDSYFVMDLFGSYGFPLFNGKSLSKVFVQVNNLFDNLYSAYAIGKEFFPAAERNFIAGIQLGL
ncbi:MAG: TonB-dependent receptor [Ignavibacteriaceae bacterium]|nr:TonB-dependent receptor [Ignavibacteriaceae bacterium]